MLFSPNQRVAAFPPTTRFPSSPLSIELNKKPPFFSIQSKANAMKTKDRIAVLLCVKGFFFSTCVCRVCVLEKSVTREQNESNPPSPSPTSSSHYPSHFSHPTRLLPLRPSFLTHSTKTYSPHLTHSTRITKITNTQHTTNELQNARLTEVLVVRKTSLSLRKNNKEDG